MVTSQQRLKFYYNNKEAVIKYEIQRIDLFGVDYTRMLSSVKDVPDDVVNHITNFFGNNSYLC